MWEELKALQHQEAPRGTTREQLRDLEKADKADEKQRITAAYRDLVDILRNKSTSPGSLCSFSHKALLPVYDSTGIESSRTAGHPCVLVAKFLGKERWLWCTKDKRRVERNLKKLNLSVAEHLVEIPAECSEEIDINEVDRRRYSARTIQAFDTIVQKSYRKVPTHTCFLGAHWLLFYGRPTVEGGRNLSRYLGLIPDHIFDAVQEKTGFKKDG